MSEVKKLALETIAAALPQLDDFSKGRLVGMAEGMAAGVEAVKETPPSEAAVDG